MDQPPALSDGVIFQLARDYLLVPDFGIDAIFESLTRKNNEKSTNIPRLPHH